MIRKDRLVWRRYGAVSIGLAILVAAGWLSWSMWQPHEVNCQWQSQEVGECRLVMWGLLGPETTRIPIDRDTLAWVERLGPSDNRHVVVLGDGAGNVHLTTSGEEDQGGKERMAQALGEFLLEQPRGTHTFTHFQATETHHALLGITLLGLLMLLFPRNVTELIRDDRHRELVRRRRRWWLPRSGEQLRLPLDGLREIALRDNHATPEGGSVVKREADFRVSAQLNDGQQHDLLFFGADSDEARSASDQLRQLLALDAPASVTSSRVTARVSARPVTGGATIRAYGGPAPLVLLFALAGFLAWREAQSLPWGGYAMLAIPLMLFAARVIFGRGTVDLRLDGARNELIVVRRPFWMGRFRGKAVHIPATASATLCLKSGTGP